MNEGFCQQKLCRKRDLKTFKAIGFYKKFRHSFNFGIVCVYCNHCQPCPAGLDVGLINKYYDLAKAGDQLAKDHYQKLEKKASDCIQCGHCDSRCPFQVEQTARMEEIAGYFGI